MLTEPHHPVSSRRRVVLVLVLAMSLLCSALAIAGHFHHDGHDNDTHCAFCLAAAHFGGVPTPVVPITNVTPDIPLCAIAIDVWHDARPQHYSQPRAPPLT